MTEIWKGRRIGAMAAAMAVILAIGVGALWGTPGARAQATLLEKRESLYNNIYIYQNGTYISMLFGRNRRLFTESVVNIEDLMELPSPYTQVLTVAMAYAPKLDRVVEIGTGGARTSWYIHKLIPEAQVETVELDSVVLDMAKKYFRIRDSQRFKTVVADGRKFLRRPASENYDLIFVDAYRGTFVPFHLTTREFYAEAKKALAPGGVLAQNVEPTTLFFDANYATISAVFDHVDVYPARGNFILVAYDGPERTDKALLARAEALDRSLKPRYSLVGLARTRNSVSAPPGGQVLTDDFAPIDHLRRQRTE